MVKLNENENLLYLSKRHFIYGFPWKSLIIIFLLPIIYYFINYYVINYIGKDFVYNDIQFNILDATFYFFIFLFLIFFLAFLFYYYLWLNNLIIITNQRCIIKTKKGLFDEDIKSLPLVKITGVSVHKEGIIDMILNIGDILIETASDIQDIQFTKLPNPKNIQNILENQLHISSKNKKNEE